MNGTVRSNGRRPRWVLALGLLGALALVAGACSSGSDGDVSSGGTSRTTAAADKGADATPKKGGRLVVGSLFDVFSGDPAKAIGSITDGSIGVAVFDPLMTFDKDANVVPFLAKSLDSSDKQHWRMTLNEGVKFHDGTVLDAEAVKWNLLRHQDPAVASRQATNASFIESINVVDAATLEINLKFPWAAFPEVLITPFGWIASPTALQADPAGFVRKPIGSGPFTFAESVPGDHTTLKANPNYWRKGEPYLDEVVFRPVLDTVTRFESAKKGEIQLAQTTNGAELAQAKDAGLQVFPVLGPGITTQFNTTKPPFDDKRLRLAVWHATDTKAINDVIFKGSGPNPPYFTLLERGSPYYSKVDFPAYDPAKAKALVDEVKADGGSVSFTYACHTQPDLVNMAEMLRQMWTQAGMDVKVSIQDQNAVVLNIFTKNYQASCFGTTTRRDPDLTYYGSLHSTSSTNSTGYSNPVVDEALDTGRRTADEKVRKQAYAKVQQAIAEDAPLFMTSSAPWGWFGSDAVHGMYTARNGAFHAGQVWLGG